MISHLVFLMISDAEYLHICCLVCIFLEKNIYAYLLPIFYLRCLLLLLLLSYMSSLYVLDIDPLLII